MGDIERVLTALEPTILHDAVRHAIVTRRALMPEVDAMDQMWACVRDVFLRAGMDLDEKKSRALRIGLIGFLHVLVVRSDTLAEYDMVPQDIAAGIASVAAEMAVCLADLTVHDAVVAFTMVATNEGARNEVASSSRVPRGRRWPLALRRAR